MISVVTNLNILSSKPTKRSKEPQRSHLDSIAYNLLDYDTRVFYVKKKR